MANLSLLGFFWRWRSLLYFFPLWFAFELEQTKGIRRVTHF
jgi:hypothetical protein